MAKLKASPKNFAEALALLGSKQSIRLGNNTYLQLGSVGLYVAVRLHNTEIVKFHQDGRVQLFTGGYRTVTTKERINHFIYGQVFQKDRQWYYMPINPVNGRIEFYEGLAV